jgi:hypothetical protein
MIMYFCGGAYTCQSLGAIFDFPLQTASFSTVPGPGWPVVLVNEFVDSNQIVNWTFDWVDIDETFLYTQQYPGGWGSWTITETLDYPLPVTSAVPEPATWLLLLIGMFIAARVRRNARSHHAKGPIDCDRTSRAIP